MKTLDGAQQIAIERNRQIQKEGWTPQHDDTHRKCELNHAARSYLLAAIHIHFTAAVAVPYCWPWARKWWKPADDPIRNLVKGGALIAAEIDRLQRLRSKSQR